jgi:hypothetical protein
MSAMAALKSMEVTREALARALYDAFKETHPDAYIEDFSKDYPINIDGKFHLQAIVSLFIAKYCHLSAQALSQKGQTLLETS